MTFYSQEVHLWPMTVFGPPTLSLPIWKNTKICLTILGFDHTVWHCKHWQFILLGYFLCIAALSHDRNWDPPSTYSYYLDATPPAQYAENTAYMRNIICNMHLCMAQRPLHARGKFTASSARPPSAYTLWKTLKHFFLLHFNKLKRAYCHIDLRIVGIFWTSPA